MLTTLLLVYTNYKDIRRFCLISLTVICYTSTEFHTDQLPSFQIVETHKHDSQISRCNLISIHIQDVPRSGLQKSFFICLFFIIFFLTSYEIFRIQYQCVIDCRASLRISSLKHTLLRIE